METRYQFKSNPNDTFQLTIEPFHSWTLDLYSVMQDKSFVVRDIMHSIGLTGDEAMSLLTYMLFDLRCIRPT